MQKHTGDMAAWMPKLFKNSLTCRRKKLRNDEWNFSPPAEYGGISKLRCIGGERNTSIHFVLPRIRPLC